MKNEEIQRLSLHDEGDHNLKINNNLQNNSKSESINLNVNQVEPNKNIQQSQPQIPTNTNQTDMEERLKNFNPQQHNYKLRPNFNPHSHHNHMHMHMHEENTFDRYRRYILVYTKYINMRIQMLFEGLTNTIDSTIQKAKLHPLIKRFLHSKQILLIIYMINIQYLLSSVEKISFLNALNRQTLRFMIFSVIGLNVHYYFFRNKLYVEKDEELERFISSRNPEIKKGSCEECQVLRICRSFHCQFCGKCVKKFQLHSGWFNICIGANNELLYALALLFVNLYLLCSNLIFWYYVLVKYNLLNYLFLLFFLFALAGVYINFNSLSFLYSFIVENLFKNLSYFESKYGRRLTYLWRDERRMFFFNPFDKGIQRNLEEMIVNLFDVDIYSGYKSFASQNLDEIIEDEKPNENEENEQNNFFNDIIAYKLMLKITEHFDPFVTSKGHVYKFVDGNEIINWNRLIIFTPFDIINCPFKDSMIKNTKMMIERREMYLKNLRQNKINIENLRNIEKEAKKENKEENKEDHEEKKDENEEKIDEKEEKKEEHEEKIDESEEKIDENEEKIDEIGETKEENGDTIKENEEKKEEIKEENKEEKKEENIDNNEPEKNGE